MKRIIIGKWCTTWKSLILSYNGVELFILAFQVLGKYSRGFYGLRRIDGAIAILHLVAICEMFVYIKNYKIMIQEYPQKKSKVKFFFGLFLMISIEIIGILITIFL